MARERPLTYTQQLDSGTQARSKVNVSDFKDIAAHQNLLWSQWINRWGGYLLSLPDVAPAYTKESNSYTEEIANPDRNRPHLKEINTIGKFQRQTDNGSGLFIWGAHADRVDIQVILYNATQGWVGITNDVVSWGTSTAWKYSTFRVDSSDWDDGDLIDVRWRWQYNAAGGSDRGRLFSAGCGTAELPQADKSEIPAPTANVAAQSPTITSTATVSSSPGAIRTQSPTFTSDATVTSVPAAIRTQSPTVTSDAIVKSTSGAIRTQSPTVTSDATVTSSPEKISGAFLLGTGDAEESKYGPTTTFESLTNINTDAYGEQALVEYITGQNIYTDPDIDPHIALGDGGFEDGTLTNELPSSDYSRGSVTFYQPAQVSRNGEDVYAAPNNGQVTASLEAGVTATFDSVAIVDGSSVGSGVVVSWFEVPEQTTSSDVAFADGEFELQSGYEDLSLYMNELVVYTLIGDANWAGAKTSTITPHVTLFDADPGQSGSANEIAGSRVTVTSWSNVGQKNERFAAENDNSFTVSVPDGVDATHIGIYDGDQGSGANQLIVGSLGENISPDANSDITFSAGAVRVAAG